jgi:O-antigen/teichoic acid export membrane protein
LIGFALLAVISRRVGATNLGAWYYATNLSNYFAIPTFLGMQTLATRDIARAPDTVRRVTGEVLAWQVGVGVIMYGVVLLLARPVFATSPLTATLIPVACLYFVVGAFTLDWGLQAIRRGALLGILQLGGQLAYGIIVLLTLTRGMGEIRAYAWANVAGLLVAAIGTVVAFCLLRGLPTFPRSLAVIVRRAGRSLPFAATILLVQVYWSLGPILLTTLGTTAETGEFGVALRLPVALIVLSRVWINTVYPHSAALARERPAEFGRQIVVLAQLGVRIGIPVVIIAAATGRGDMTELFGPGYAAAGGPFALLTGVAVVLFVSANLANALLALDLEGLYVRLAGLGLVINVLITVVLISPLGVLAPGIALLAAEATVAVGAWLRLRRSVPHVAFEFRPLVRTSPALLALGASLWLTAALPAILRGVLAATVFAACATPLGLLRDLGPTVSGSDA